MKSPWDTFAWRPEEVELCLLKMHAFFGFDVMSNTQYVSLY